MIIKETNASEMICQEQFFQGGQSGTCQGSKCMAWRWILAENKLNPAQPLKSTTHGYCGVAGVPQGANLPQGE